MRTQGLGAIVRVEESPDDPSPVRLLEPKTAPAGTGWHVPKLGPKSGSSLLEVLAARSVDPARGEGDGVAFVQETLREIRRLKLESPEVRAVVVFDLDNTLFETRARTLAAMRAFDERHGTAHFAELSIEDMGKNGKHTAELAGVPELAEAVQAFWLEFFWDGKNFLLDQLITRVAELAHEAHAAGAEVVYLTGRVDAEATLAQLSLADLPNADPEHLVTKPAVGTNTGKFKGVWLQDLMERPDTFLGWFLTEGRRDIATVQEHDARIPCVRLGYVHEREGHDNLPGTPLLPESWCAALRPLGG